MSNRTFGLEQATDKVTAGVPFEFSEGLLLGEHDSPEEEGALSYSGGALSLGDGSNPLLLKFSEETSDVRSTNSTSIERYNGAGWEAVAFRPAASQTSEVRSTASTSIERYNGASWDAVSFRPSAVQTSEVRSTSTDSLERWSGADWQSVSVGRDPNQWVTEFELDFTAQTPVDLKAGGDGVLTLEGVDFEILNSASSTVMSIGASGLEIQVAGGPYSNFNGARTAPIFYALLGDMVPNVTSFDEFRLTFDFDFIGTPTANYEYLTVGFHSDNPGNFGYTQGLFYAGVPGLVGMGVDLMYGLLTNPTPANKTFAALGHIPGGARLTWGQTFNIEVSTQTFAAEADIDAMLWRMFMFSTSQSHISQWDFSTVNFKPIVMFSFDLSTGATLDGYRVRKFKIERRVSMYPVTLNVP